MYTIIKREWFQFLCPFWPTEYFFLSPKHTKYKLFLIMINFRLHFQCKISHHLKIEIINIFSSLRVLTSIISNDECCLHWYPDNVDVLFLKRETKLVRMIQNNLYPLLRLWEHLLWAKLDVKIKSGIFGKTNVQKERTFEVWTRYDQNNLPGKIIFIMFHCSRPWSSRTSGQ